MVKKLQCEIVLEYDDAKTAKAIAKAVSPDNIEPPRGLLIETTCRGRRVITKLNCEKSLPTFIATIDDLLFCVSTAEKAIQVTKKLHQTVKP